MKILAIDVGTSGMKGIIYDGKGSALGRTLIAYTPTYIGERVEQNPANFKDAIIKVIGWAGGTASGGDGKIDAIALTAQRSSCICVGADGEPLGPAICWQDKRTVELCEKIAGAGKTNNAQPHVDLKLCQKFPEGEKTHGAQPHVDICVEEPGSDASKIIQQKSGTHINPVFLASKITWIRENNPELYARTWKFMTIADYLMFLLTGETVTDDTYGSRTHLMNIETRDWDDELLEIFKIEREKLCDIVPVGSMVGRLKPEIAEAAEIHGTIPVYTCGGDQQCALIGQGIAGRESSGGGLSDLDSVSSVSGNLSFEKLSLNSANPVDCGKISVTLGTGLFIGTQIDELPQVRSREVIYNTSSIYGKYIVEYGTPTCAAAVNWFLREIYGGLPIEKIDEELAKTAKGAGGVRALPYFQGRFTPDYNSSARATFAGISLSTRREDMLRALIEGIAEEIGQGVELVKTACEDVENSAKTEIIVGGGLSRSQAVCQIIEETIGCKITINDDKDATAYGAYLVARKSMGCSGTIVK